MQTQAVFVNIIFASKIKIIAGRKLGKKNRRGIQSIHPTWGIPRKLWRYFTELGNIPGKQTGTFEEYITMG